jgi:hypothetical protein
MIDGDSPLPQRFEQNIACSHRVLNARLMPTPPTGDIACAASPIHKGPGETTLTVGRRGRSKAIPSA